MFFRLSLAKFYGPFMLIFNQMRDFDGAYIMVKEII